MEDETALAPGTTIRFGDVAVLFEPHDDVPTPLVSGTQVPERVEADAGPAAGGRGGPHRRAAGRRVVPSAPPRPSPSGPPAWLVALLVLIGLVIAYLLLTSS